jgi:hypothetical protein
VQICILNSTGCRTIDEFTVDDKGPSRVRVTKHDDQYSVEWKTKPDFSVDETYRVRVLDNAQELGHADVKLFKKGKEAKSVPSGFVGLNAGATLPIKFRIETTTTARAVRLVIRPSTFLLPGTGRTRQLVVEAYDSNGNLTAPGPLTWRSSNSGVISVSSSGIATALVQTGSSQVTVESGSVKSAPAVGMISSVAAGAFLVHDENLLLAPGASTLASTNTSTASKDLIVPVNATAAYKPGWQYKVYMTGPAPAVGQIVISDGESPVVAGSYQSTHSATSRRSR